MKAKRVLLGLLVAGLVVIGLSGVVWGDDGSISSNHGDAESGIATSLNPTVNWHIPCFIVMYIPDMTTELTEMERAVSDLESATSDTVIYWIKNSDSEDTEVYVATNDPDGYTVTVSAADGGGAVSADTSRFYVKVGSSGEWTALNTAQPIITYSSNGVNKTSGIKYRYGLTTQDEPTTNTNARVVNLTYTATTK